MKGFYVITVDMRQENPGYARCADRLIIGGFKAGTQQIEKVVREDFPEVRTLRMDFDTTRTKGSYRKDTLQLLLLMRQIY